MKRRSGAAEIGSVDMQEAEKRSAPSRPRYIKAAVAQRVRQKRSRSSAGEKPSAPGAELRGRGAQASVTHVLGHPVTC